MYAVSVSTDPVRLGTGFRECKKCHGEISDGSREWTELSRWERFRFWVPTGMMIWLVFGTIAVASILSEGAKVRDVLGLAGFFIVPIIAYWLSRPALKRKSLERVERAKVDAAVVGRG